MPDDFGKLGRCCSPPAAPSLHDPPSRSRGAVQARHDLPRDSTQRAYEDYQGIGELGTEGWNEFEKHGARRTARTSWVGRPPRPREFTQGIQIRRKRSRTTCTPVRHAVS